eukprot:UN23384
MGAKLVIQNLSDISGSSEGGASTCQITNVVSRPLKCDQKSARRSAQLRPLP